MTCRLMSGKPPYRRGRGRRIEGDKRRFGTESVVGQARSSPFDHLVAVAGGTIHAHEDHSIFPQMRASAWHRASRKSRSRTPLIQYTSNVRHFNGIPTVEMFTPTPYRDGGWPCPLPCCRGCVGHSAPAVARVVH